MLFKAARAKARRIRRIAKKESWVQYVSSINSTTNSKVIWDKIRKINGNYSSHPLLILESNGIQISNIKDIVNSLGKAFSDVSSSQNYPTRFLSIKSNIEKQSLNFNQNKNTEYNSPF